MINRIIADTGIIVAFLSQRDQWRAWTTEQMRHAPAPYLTCEAVIAEACYILRSTPGGKSDVLSMVEAGILKVEFSLAAESAAIAALIKKYNNVSMSFADACLVRMSEIIEDSVVFTVDSDFLVYRKSGRKRIPLIYPA